MCSSRCKCGRNVTASCGNAQVIKAVPDYWSKRNMPTAPAVARVRQTTFLACAQTQIAKNKTIDEKTCNTNNT